MPWVAPAQELRLKTHCVRGHEYEAVGIYRKEDGHRRCCECRREDARANYWRKREAA
jgi:hypothetical protein